MSILAIVMIVAFVVIAIVIGLTIWTTNKAYHVLPSLSKVDPLPEDGNNKTKSNENEEEVL